MGYADGLQLEALQIAVLVSKSGLQLAVCVRITECIVSVPGEKPQACREYQAASCAAPKLAE